MTILVDFMGEGALEIRERSKNILSKVLDKDKTGKATKMIPASILDKIKKKESSEISQSKLMKTPVR